MNNETTVQSYFDRSPESYGSAGLTQLEIKAYKSLIRRVGSVDKAREWMESGMELPLHSNSVRNDFLEAALVHGCSVAGNIDADVVEGRAGRTYEDTTWSYLTKNRAYRFIEMGIIKNGNADLLEEWKGGFQKQPYEIGDLDQTLTRPLPLQGNEERTAIVTGIEKPACYFPSQLLRVLDALRLGKESIVEITDANGKRKVDILSETSAQFMIESGKASSIEKVAGINRESFTFYWDSLEEAINNSNTTSDIAVNVALTVADYLKNTQQLRDSVISLVIAKGYSPNGPISEHGLKQDVSTIWDRLLIELHGSDPGLWEQLRARYIRALNGNNKTK